MFDPNKATVLVKSRKDLQKYEQRHLASWECIYKFQLGCVPIISPKQCFDKRNPKQCFDINNEREHLRYAKSEAELLFRGTKTLPSGLIERLDSGELLAPGIQKYRFECLLPTS
ncbi:hypothetical protein CEXT_285271 [Caerostris extrusa]|uniref:Uncharacterized protein n=1 Tax=Caerostris extrusa TaxID=172846 RepID=A0AAV4XKH5_CAEEX|nr:hypothetical protein CEXT_285271 [Caerostris extrusa]